jgi:hypothetical protein
MNTPESVERDYLSGRRHRILEKARLSARYHQRRERFFEWWDKAGKVVGFVAGSAALWKLADQAVVLWVLLLITAWSAVSLVFSLSDRAKRHAEFAVKWREFEARVLAKGERNFEESDLDRWESEAAMLESTEPPELSALVVDVQNELAIAAGQPEKVWPLRWWERRLMHFVDLPRTRAHAHAAAH